MDKKDISVLVIEKFFHPIQGAQSESRVYKVCRELSVVGINVDLVWSIKGHRFRDFEAFVRKGLNTFSLFDRNHRYVSYFMNHLRYMRRCPINSIEDLAKYNAIIAHLPNADIDMMRDFQRIYRNTPVIFPRMGAASPMDCGGQHVVSEQRIARYTMDLLRPLRDRRTA